MCSKPVSGDDPIKYSPSHNMPPPQLPTHFHLDQLIALQIEVNKKRQETLLSQLPIENQELIFSLTKDLYLLRDLIIQKKNLPLGSKELKSLSAEIDQAFNILKAKYKNCDFFHIEFLVSQKTVDVTDCLFYSEVSRNIFVNKLLYLHEVNRFVEEKKALICREFLPRDFSNIPMSNLKFVISLKDVEEKVLGDTSSLNTAPAETHNFGKAPAFIYFFSEGKLLFKVVYKPRDALIDKTVIDTFILINRLNESERTSKIPMPELNLEVILKKIHYQKLKTGSLMKNLPSI